MRCYNHIVNNTDRFCQAPVRQGMATDSQCQMISNKTQDENRSTRTAEDADLLDQAGPQDTCRVQTILEQFGLVARQCHGGGAAAQKIAI